MEPQYEIPKSIEDFFDLFYKFIEETANKLSIPVSDRQWLNELKTLFTQNQFILPIDVIRNCQKQDPINEYIYDIENLSKRFNYDNVDPSLDRIQVIKYKSQIETLCFLVYFYLSITTLLKNGQNLNSIKYSFVFRYNHLYKIITDFLNTIFPIFGIEESNYNYYRTFLLSSTGNPLYNVSFIKNDIIGNLNFNNKDKLIYEKINKFFHDCLQIDDFFILRLKNNNQNSIIISGDKYRDHNNIECGEYNELLNNILPCVMIDKYNRIIDSYTTTEIFNKNNQVNGFYLINTYNIPYKSSSPINFTNFFDHYDKIYRGLSPMDIRSLPPDTTNLQKNIESTSGQVMENIEKIDEDIRGMAIDNSKIILSYTDVHSFITDTGATPMDIDGGKYYKKYLKYKTKYLKLKNNEN